MRSQFYSCFFLASFIFSDLPLYQSDFEELEEFTRFEETYETFMGESLVASSDLTQYAHSEGPIYPKEDVPEFWQEIFKKHVKKESLVIDYGTGYGGHVLFFARLVGGGGKVLAFTSGEKQVRSLFYHLVSEKVSQARIFSLEDGSDLDTFQLDEVSFMRIDAKGREDLILHHAVETIQKYRPVIAIRMLGGIPLERANSYSQQALEERLAFLHDLGYRTERFTGMWYLALPFSKN